MCLRMCVSLFLSLCVCFGSVGLSEFVCGGGGRGEEGNCLNICVCVEGGRRGGIV
mgnify:CR=1 FL=1